MRKCKSGNESCCESDSVNDERDDADHEAGHERKEGGRPEEQERHGHESGSDGGDRARVEVCLLYTSPSPRDGLLSRMPSSA